MSERNITEADVDAIVAKMGEGTAHHCRFIKLSSEEIEEFREAAKFYKHYNQVMGETGATVRKTIIVMGVGGTASLIAWGAVTKAKQLLGL